LIRVFLFCFFVVSQIFSEQVNEMGGIPIMTYHRISDSDTEYSRNYQSFRNDLQFLYENGFHPISIVELDTGKITAPKGKIPVILSFDDSSIQQFEYDAKGQISKNTALGIMEEFEKSTKGWKAISVFFVTPGAKSPNNFFGQPDLNKKKADYLISKGHSIENHTLWHANMRKYNNRIEEQIGVCISEVRKYLPNHDMKYLAMPFGIFPKDPDLPRLIQGTYKTTNYKNNLIFDYSNRVSDSPYSQQFNRYHVKRLHGNENGIKALQRAIKKNELFISDGNPNTITISKSQTVLLSGITKKGFDIQTY
jgi:hypothetical protein